MSEVTQTRKRPSLTSPGVIILQSFALFVMTAFDIYFSKSIGILTGVTLVVVFTGGALLARRKARSWSAITPPLALVFSLIILLPLVGTSHWSPARLGVDVLNALAAVAPYLVLGAVVTWLYVLSRSRSTS